jgi:DnaJ domain
MRVRTHYQNLKVARDAPQEVIEAAYRALSLKYGPGSNPHADAARVRRLIDDAYAVLSSAEHRRRHDEWIDRTDGRSGEACIDSSRLQTWMRDRLLLWGVCVAALVGLGLFAWRPWSEGVTEHTTAARTVTIAPSTTPSVLTGPRDQPPAISGALPRTALEMSEGRSPPPRVRSSNLVSTGEWTPVGPDTPLCSMPLPLPDTDVMTKRWSPESAGSPELWIQASGKVGNVYAKVLSTTDRNVVATAFVRKDGKLRVRLQPGSYKLRYVRIESWYGADLVKACAAAPATEGNDTIELHSAIRSGDSMMKDIVTVELQQQLGGNFATHKIPIDDF